MNAEFLDKLWEQVCVCVDECENAERMLDEHDGPVARQVRRAIKQSIAAVDEAVFVVSRASKKAEKAERPSATVHPLWPTTQ